MESEERSRRETIRNSQLISIPLLTHKSRYPVSAHVGFLCFGTCGNKSFIDGVMYRCFDCKYDGSRKHGINDVTFCENCFFEKKSSHFEEFPNHSFVKYPNPVQDAFGKYNLVENVDCHHCYCGRVFGVYYRCDDCCSDYLLCDKCFPLYRFYHPKNHTFTCVVPSSQSDFENTNEEVEKMEDVFPCDCIGIILEYSTSSDVFFGFYFSCLTVARYIIDNFERCCKNIEFKLIDIRSLKLRCPYVSKLSVFEMFLKSFPFELDDETKKIKLSKRPPTMETLLRFFPKLSELSLYYTHHLNGKMLKSTYVKKLRKLKLVECGTLENDDFFSLKNLESLEIDESHKTSSYYLYTDELLLHLPELRILILDNVHFCSDGFKELRKLEKLVLHRCQNLTDNVFAFLPNLAVLKMTKCRNFHPSGFQFLVGKLKNLKIDKCDSLRRTPLAWTLLDLENFEVEEIKKKPRKKHIMMGLIIPLHLRAKSDSKWPQINIRNPQHKNQQYIHVLTNGTTPRVNPRIEFETI